MFTLSSLWLWKIQIYTSYLIYNKALRTAEIDTMGIIKDYRQKTAMLNNNK